MNNRVIKFKAWNHEDKEMIQDVHDGMMIQMNSGQLGFYDDDGAFQECRYKILQFTGMMDKNGKDIYEGDICRVLYTDWPSKTDGDTRPIKQYMQDISNIGCVEFVDCMWSFHFISDVHGDDWYGSFHVGAHGMIEVIGNIFETPELLEL